MSGDSGFSVFALDHAQHIRTIRKRLESVRSDHADRILSKGISDWADYQYRLGCLDGINEALHVCDEIEKAERA